MRHFFPGLINRQNDLGRNLNAERNQRYLDLVTAQTERIVPLYRAAADIYIDLGLEEDAVRQKKRLAEALSAVPKLRPQAPAVFREVIKLFEGMGGHDEEVKAARNALFKTEMILPKNGGKPAGEVQGPRAGDIIVTRDELDKIYEVN